MNKRIIYILFCACTLMVWLSSCGEDRSWQYYEKIQSKTWMYETMEKNYLFYEDLPLADGLDFFSKPKDFLSRTASRRDGKNGILFSHVDSVFNSSRADNNPPSFGFEGVIMRVGNTNAIRVLYTQKDSPAQEMGLKRGDWIIAVDSAKISTNDYFKYIGKPVKAHEFMMGALTADGFDTLNVIRTPEPRIVQKRSILEHKLVKSGSRTAFYILYNEFEDDQNDWHKLFTEMSGYQFDDVIIDLRYNPGGYVSTAQLICTNLAPSEATGNVFMRLIPNKDLTNKEIVYHFDPELLNGGKTLQYNNLYVITTGNSASASEALINCLRPYMKGRLLHVGTNTFGKNVAQQLFEDNDLAPMLEFWLTTSYVANSEGFMDYFENGLTPDFQVLEDMGGILGDFATEQDKMMTPVFYHMANGCFPQGDPDHQEGDKSSRLMTLQVEELYNPIAHQPKSFKLTK